VMEQGSITEIGTHDELLGLSGTYRRLHDLQFRTDAVAEDEDPGPAEGIEGAA
jgi:subfamily B ATP-binding cassette protein MsbA